MNMHSKVQNCDDEAEVKAQTCIIAHIPQQVFFFFSPLNERKAAVQM